jgi:very-short-patch-repair endonuclease
VTDFACVAANLIVEIDGATHGSSTAIAHDARRTAYLEHRGWMVIRFSNDVVYRNLSPVLDAIWRAVDWRSQR